jgi:hypothetical protein
MRQKGRNRQFRQSDRITPDEGSDDESDSGGHRIHAQADRLGSNRVALSRYWNDSPTHQSQPHRNTHRPRQSLQDLAYRHQRLNNHTSTSRCVDQSAFLINIDDSKPDSFYPSIKCSNKFISGAQMKTLEPIKWTGSPRQNFCFQP